MLLKSFILIVFNSNYGYEIVVMIMMKLHFLQECEICRKKLMLQFLK